ncbi:MAG: tetratricopeptide repeat protein [Planctomycetota bacterium]|nr:tetratricopeptide repeat protein [Planctomycetota bacterium]
MYGSSRAAIIIGLWAQSLMLLPFAGCTQQQDVVALYVDAVTLREAGQNDAAIKQLNAAVRSDRDFTLAHSLMCEIYQEMNDYERSVISCTRAVQLNPWSFEDHFNLGWSFLMMKRPELAGRAFSKACEINPGHLAANVNAAMSYYEIRDYRRALFYGKRIQQIDPNTEGIQDFINDVQQATGQIPPPGRQPLR